MELKELFSQYEENINKLNKMQKKYFIHRR